MFPAQELFLVHDFVLRLDEWTDFLAQLCELQLKHAVQLLTRRVDELCSEELESVPREVHQAAHLKRELQLALHLRKVA